MGAWRVYSRGTAGLGGCCDSDCINTMNNYSVCAGAGEHSSHCMQALAGGGAVVNNRLKSHTSIKSKKLMVRGEIGLECVDG